MYAAFAARRLRGALGALLFVMVSMPATAIDFWDGKLEVHGFYEQQIRSIWDDFSGADDWDLTQWYHVLNLEIEADIAPDGFGPFDAVSAFALLSSTERSAMLESRLVSLKQQVTKGGNDNNPHQVQD